MKQLDVRTAAHIDLDDVRIRPYGVTDRDRVHRMSDRLSAASLYTRFFSGTPRVPDHYLRLLDGLDHWDREALIGLDGEEILGIAEYVRDKKQPWRADIAVLVTDPWKRRGLGSVLVACLSHLAARRGIIEFDADVVLENRPAIHFVHTWPDARSTNQGGSVHFYLPLPVGEHHGIVSQERDPGQGLGSAAQVRHQGAEGVSADGQQARCDAAASASLSPSGGSRGTSAG